MTERNAIGAYLNAQAPKGSRPFVRHMAAIQSGNVTATNMLGIRKALNKHRHGPRWSGGITSPATTKAECDLLLSALQIHKPLVRGDLHASGVKLVTGKRYAKRLAPVADKVATLQGFRLVGYDWTPDGTAMPLYVALSEAGAFMFCYEPWQSGGDGLRLLKADYHIAGS